MVATLTAARIDAAVLTAFAGHIRAALDVLYAAGVSPNADGEFGSVAGAVENFRTVALDRAKGKPETTPTVATPNAETGPKPAAKPDAAPATVAPCLHCGVKCSVAVLTNGYCRKSRCQQAAAAGKPAPVPAPGNKPVPPVADPKPAPKLEAPVSKSAPAPVAPQAKPGTDKAASVRAALSEGTLTALSAACVLCGIRNAAVNDGGAMRALLTAWLQDATTAARRDAADADAAARRAAKPVTADDVFGPAPAAAKGNADAPKLDALKDATPVTECCKGKRKDGERCGMVRVNADGYCRHHAEQAKAKPDAPKADAPAVSKTDAPHKAGTVLVADGKGGFRPATEADLWAALEALAGKRAA